MAAGQIMIGRGGFRTDDCPDTVYGFHGPADAHGRCPWCGRPDGFGPRRPHRAGEVSELTDAYERHYDPDYGALDPVQIRHRYAHGQDF